MKKCFGLVFCFALLVPTLLHAVSTPNVPPASPLYAQIDKLIAFGLVKSAVYGQRPWSRNEMARLTSEALKKFGEKCPPEAGPPSAGETSPKACGFIGDILDSLKREFRDEMIARGDQEGKRKNIDIHMIDTGSVEFLFTSAEFRAVPADNGLGAIDARVNPFTTYKEGAHTVRGADFAIEADHWARLSKYASLYLRPRFTALVDYQGDGRADVTLQNAYAKFNIANFEIEAGRDAVLWGHSTEGGVLASTHVRPMDLVKISNDSPFKLPWIFRHLGYNKYTFFVSTLGPESIFKNALMYGFAASLKPASFIELGFEHQFTFGGEGAPDIDFLDLLSEFFLYRRNGGGLNSANDGDNRFGLNVRIQIPRLRNTTLYAEGIFEDYGKESFFHQFTQQMAFQSGVTIPLLTSNGKNSLRLQYEHIPAAYGRHGLWISGLSQNGLSRGSPYGSQSQTVSAEWGHLFSLRKRLNVRAMYTNNGNDQFTTTPSSSGGPDRVIKTVDNPQEHRFLVEGAITWPLSRRWTVEPQVGYEYAANFNFIQNDDRQNIALGIVLTHDFGLSGFLPREIRAR